MKLNIVKQFVICFALLGVSACTATNNIGNLKFKKYEKIEKIHLQGDVNAPFATLTLKVDYPISGNEDLVNWVSEVISEQELGKQFTNLAQTEALDAFAKSYAEDYRDEVEELYLENVERVKQGEEEGIGFWYNYIYSLDSELILSSQNLLVFRSHGEVYTGGAHGFNSFQYLNLDLESKQIIRYEDLFNPNDAESLTQLIKAQLRIDRNAEDLTEAGFWEKDITPSKNFGISKGGITFMYNGYEIAPYVMGSSEVLITYDKLKGLINPENVILKQFLE